MQVNKDHCTGKVCYAVTFIKRSQHTLNLTIPSAKKLRMSGFPPWGVLNQCYVSTSFETSTTQSTLPIKRHMLNVSPTSSPHLMVSIDVQREEGSPYSDPFQNQISRNTLYLKQKRP